jgi:hypothetical protein
MSSVTSRLAGLVAAALAAAAGLVGITAVPATAAFCSGSGVNVVVDFKSLGGGVQKGCDPRGAGRSAEQVFPAAGFGLDYVVNSGFVCRVKAKPAGEKVCQQTPPASAYWGLYWSDGKSGWKYSSRGVTGTSVPNGGSIAFSWQTGGGPKEPRVDPARAKSVPAPAPKEKPTKAPQKVRTQQSESGSAPAATKAPKPKTPTKTSAAAGEKPPKPKKAQAKKTAPARASKRAKASPSASAKSSASASAAADPSDEVSPDVTSAKPVDSTFAPEEDQGGLPVWVPIVVIVALAGAAGGTAWWRRRTGAP